MLNPYESTPQKTSFPIRGRSVRRYLILAALAIAMGSVAGIPGTVLLNQNWQLVPTNTQLTDIEFDGRPISTVSVMRTSLIAGGCLLFSGVVSLAIGLRNRWLNKTDTG
jgi:hypothetical protein